MKLLHTFSKYTLGSVLTLIAGLIATPILTRLITTEEMGKYSMFTTLGGLAASILYLGLDQSYVRFYNDEKETARVYLLRKCLAAPVVATVVVSCAVLIAYCPVSNVILGRTSFMVAACFAVYLIGLVVDRFWLLKIRMAQKAGWYSLLNMTRKLAYLAIAVVLFYTIFGDSGWTLIIAVTAAEGVLLIGARLVERRNWKLEEEKLATSTRQLFTYGLPFVFSSTITYIFHSTDKLMLKALSNYHEIGLYSGAQNIVHLLTQVQMVFTTFWMPVAYEHYSEDPEDKEFFITANKIISYGMLVIAILLLCTKDIVVLFLGKNYQEAVYIFPFLSFMPIMYTVSESTVMGINFMKKSSCHVWISAACAGANAAGNYFLINAFGAKGAAISTGLSYVLFFALRTFLANRVYPIKFATGRFLLSCLMVYVLAVMASFQKTSLMFLILAVAVILVISFLYRDVIKMTCDLIVKQIKKKEE